MIMMVDFVVKIIQWQMMVLQEGGGVSFLGFCFWYCRRRRDNRNDEPPNCAYKYSVTMDVKVKNDACMTFCCWEPKQVIVDNNPLQEHKYKWMT